MFRRGCWFGDIMSSLCVDRIVSISVHKNVTSRLLFCVRVCCVCLPTSIVCGFELRCFGFVSIEFGAVCVA